MIRVTQIVECEDLGLHCSGVLLDCDPQWLYHHFRCKYCEWRIMANCPRSLTLSVALFQGTYSFHLRWLVKRWGQSGKPGLSHGFVRFTCVGRWSDGVRTWIAVLHRLTNSTLKICEGRCHDGVGRRILTGWVIGAFVHVSWRGRVLANGRQLHRQSVHDVSPRRVEESVRCCSHLNKINDGLRSLLLDGRADDSGFPLGSWCVG